MAKATIDGTIPCSNCRSTFTVENQKSTGGRDGEREVYIKCLQCQTLTLIGIYKKCGNSLVKVG